MVRKHIQKKKYIYIYIYTGDAFEIYWLEKKIKPLTMAKSNEDSDY